jgi:hypothetical protein
MLYAETNGANLILYPYGFAQLQKQNPYTNYGDNQDVAYWFPQTEIAITTGNILSEVIIATKPIINEATQSVEEDTPTLINEVWTQNWVVTTLTSDQQATLTTNESVKIRQQRDAKLTACDWTQTSDNPIANKTAWATYRQALRDLTKESGFPWDITWPTKP